ncbi:MAG: hypothetical protein CXR30_15370 [Geobacter sp.]|nr:MAG: hypothetical protein CXR30_15370 [Geobacter sp.]
MKPANQMKKWQIFQFRIFLYIMVAWIGFQGIQSTCYAYDVTLSWVADSDPTVIGYKVYYQQGSTAVPFNASGAVEGPSPIDNHALTTATVSGLDPNKAYYFAVTKYYSTGEESPYSNIVDVPEGFAPTVSITSPTNNASVSGIVSVATEALDNVGVTNVEIYVNGQLLTTEATAPYLFSWDTSGLASGVYNITAKAYDAAGNVGKSVEVSVNVVSDSMPPTVSITAPFNNATVSGLVPVSISADDNIGVSKVELYGNGVLLFVSNVPPYNYSWNTAAVSNGNYILSAKSYDASGNIGQSSDVAVSVINDTAAPSVAITSPYSNATLGGTVVVNASASDNIGVSKVEFYLNGILKSTATTAPYNFNWDTTTTVNGAYSLSAMAYDASGNIGQSPNVVVTVDNVTVSNDTTAPIIAITAPYSNVTVTGTVLVTAVSFDNVGVSKVEFYLNGVLTSSSATAPYRFSWNTAMVTNDAYALTAKAYDAAGNIGKSSTVTVTVNNPVSDTTPPTVSAFTAPSSAYTLSVPVSSFLATDNVGVTGYLITESAIAPSSGSVGWSASAPSGYTFTTTGTKTLYAWARDAAGNISAAKTATIVVSIPKTVSQDVMVLDSSTTFPTIQDAYNTVPENGTIAAKDVTLSEDLNFNRAVNVNLDGGMDASFQSTTGTTAVSGVIKISKGKVVVSKIVVR